MGKTMRWIAMAFVISGLTLSLGPSAWAKHTGGNPPGWEHGKKTGWHGAHEPPGHEKEHHHKKHHKKHHAGEEKEEAK